MNHQCGSCGSKGMTHFDGRDFSIGHGRTAIQLRGLMGWQCPDCGEIEFERASAVAYAAAGDTLVLAKRRGDFTTNAGVNYMTPARIGFSDLGMLALARLSGANVQRESTCTPPGAQVHADAHSGRQLRVQFV